MRESFKKKTENIKNVVAEELKGIFKKNKKLSDKDNKYIANLIIRVEYIFFSIHEIIKKEGASYTLNDIKYMFSSPRFPHDNVFSEQSIFIETNLKLYFNNLWSYDSLIKKEIQEYMQLSNILPDAFLYLSLFPGVDVNSDSILSKKIFEKEPFVIWNNSSLKNKTNRINFYKWLINEPILDINEPVKMISEKKLERKTTIMGVKGRKDSEYIFRIPYQKQMRKKYLGFKKEISENQHVLFEDKKRNSGNIKININDLIDFTKEILDKNDVDGNWSNRLEIVDFYNVLNKTVAKEILIKNINHWIGLPNVGKTTIMTILAAYLDLKLGLKTALILRDNVDVNGMSSVLRKSGVKATPFISTYGQNNHIKKRLENLDSVYNIKTDNVISMFSNMCILKSFLDTSMDENLINDSFCAGVRVREGDKLGESHPCPYIFECERYKSRHEFYNTNVFLTNMHSFIKSSTNKILFDKSISNAELLIKTCDVILVDEADNAVEIADQCFISQENVIEAYEKGFLEIIVDEVERNSSGKKADDKEVIEWLRVARNCKSSTEYMLEQLVENGLPSYIKKSTFTSRSVFSYLVKKMISQEYGEEYDEVNLELNEKASKIISFFSSYVDSFHQYYRNESSTSDKDKITMINTAIEILSTSGSIFSDHCKKCFEKLVKRFDIDLPRNSKKTQEFEVLFKFALSVSLVEVLYSWVQNNIGSCKKYIDSDGAVNRYELEVSYLRNFKNIIPGAVIGGQYGFSYESEQDRKYIKIKKYFNMGRYIIYQMPYLFENIDRCIGAKCILLSATSFMPYSCNYNIDISPDYILENNNKNNLKINYKKMFLRDEEGNFLKLSGCIQSKKEKILDSMAKDLCKKNIGISKIEKLLNTTLPNRERMAFAVGSSEEAVSFAKQLNMYVIQFGLKKIKLCVIPSEKDKDKDFYGCDVFPKSNLNNFYKTNYNVAIIVMKSLERGVNILTKDSDNNVMAVFSTLIYLKRPHPIPYDFSDLVAIINDYAIKMYLKKESYKSGYSIHWFTSDILKNLRRLENDFYNRTFYKYILNDETRNIILSNLLVSTHHFEGRFYRGNVPCTIVYADAAFFPEEAKGNRANESYKTSIAEGFKKYFEDLKNDTTPQGIRTYEIIRKLYGFRIDALQDIQYLI